MKNLLLPLSMVVLFCSSISTVECARLPRMINGNSTEVNEIKYVVFIEAIDYTSPRKRCTGGMLDEYHILTAAHCVIASETNDFKPSRFQVTAGTNDLNSTLPKFQRFVEKIMVPDVYNGSLKDFNLELKSPVGDIAVLKLHDPLDLSLTDRFEKLELPEVNQTNPHDDSYLEGHTLKLAGFGWNHIEDIWGEKGNLWVLKGQEGDADGKLMKANVMISDREECENDRIRGVTETYMCAKTIKRYLSEWRGVCKGDSGGPLVHKDKIVVGVVSSGASSCNENFGASTYTRVTSFRKFIDDALLGLTDGIRSKTANENGYF